MLDILVYNAHLEGQFARMAGVPLADNPYPKGSRNAREWAAGWQSTERELTRL